MSFLRFDRLDHVDEASVASKVQLGEATPLEAPYAQNDRGRESPAVQLESVPLSLLSPGENEQEVGRFRRLGDVEGNCLPLWVDQGDGGVVGSTKD